MVTLSFQKDKKSYSKVDRFTRSQKSQQNVKRAISRTISRAFNRIVRSIRTENARLVFIRAVIMSSFFLFYFKSTIVECKKEKGDISVQQPRSGAVFLVFFVTLEETSDNLPLTYPQCSDTSRCGRQRLVTSNDDSRT